MASCRGWEVLGAGLDCAAVCENVTAVPGRGWRVGRLLNRRTGVVAVTDVVAVTGGCSGQLHDVGCGWEGSNR